jgi:folate-binding protein YgfZ
MTMRDRHALLADRGVLAIDGPEARSFLQTIVTNDVAAATETHAVYAALLTPQGKYLFDFLIVGRPDGGLLLESERGRLADLKRRLTMYRLRAKATIEDVSDSHAVHAVFGPAAAGRIGLDGAEGAAAPFGGGMAFVDPRLAALGARAILPADGAAAALEAAGLQPAGADDYDRHRLALGVPDGSRDMEVDRTILLEANFEELHGVDFRKGCYVGQEVTARSKYRGLVRRRLMRVDVDGPMPEPGTPVLAGTVEAGTMRSGRDGVAIAMLRLDRLEQAAGGLVAGEARVTPVKPDWAGF